MRIQIFFSTFFFDGKDSHNNDEPVSLSYLEPSKYESTSSKYDKYDNLGPSPAITKYDAKSLHKYTGYDLNLSKKFNMLINCLFIKQ